VQDANDCRRRINLKAKRENGDIRSNKKDVTSEVRELRLKRRWVGRTRMRAAWKCTPATEQTKPHLTAEAVEETTVRARQQSTMGFVTRYLLLFLGECNVRFT